MPTVAAPPERKEAAPLAPTPPPTPASEMGTPSRYSRVLWQLAVGLIAAGVAGRLLRYFLRFPLWDDEAFVCLNFLDRDYLGLFRGLEYAQVAPLLFLWSQLTAFRLLGASELVMRLGPLLAGLASLALFWRLAWATVKPLPATLAVGFLAVARWPVSMSTFAKPYSFDLLMALVLLVPAVEWLRRPERIGWLVLLALAAPVALLGSYPAVFVAGGISVALLPAAWRSGWAARGLFAAFNLLAAAAFLGSYGVVGREQLDPVAGSVNAFLLSYWAHAFPPASPLAFVKWLAVTHTGRLMAYPVGGSNGASVVTFLLFAVGVWAWWQSGRRTLLVLALTPFALNFVAAVLRRYPYGGCCRLSQHLAPAVCLLAATGCAVLLEKLVRSQTMRLRWTGALCGLLVLCGAGGMACDLTWPYHDGDVLWERAATGKIFARTGPEDQIVVAQDKFTVEPVLRWYLETRGDQVRWKGDIDWDRMQRGAKRLWIVNTWVERESQTVGPPPLDAPAAHGWTLVERTAQVSKRKKLAEALIHCDLYEWAPPGEREAATDNISDALSR